MSFGNLDKLAIDAKTERYTIYEIEGAPGDPDSHPVLTVRFAGGSNKAYTNATLKRAASVRGSQKRALARSLERSRQWDAELYPQHVVVGWENVYDEAGEAVPFSREKCAEFLAKLLEVAPDIIDGIRAFAADADNFREQLDAEEISGN